MTDLLLASSSRCHPGGLLDHLVEAIDAWADGIDEVVFVPWARADHAAYVAAVADRLAATGRRVVGLFPDRDPAATIRRAEAVFVGGGNTFLLLDTVQRTEVAPLLRDRVLHDGLRYLGTSAGTNLACPTIQTTNDMPIVWPRGGPGALGLVGMQVNAHFVDADFTSTHQGETRRQRLEEFHQHQDRPVVALREHGWLRVRDGRTTVHGGGDTPPGRLLRRDQPDHPLPNGTHLEDLVPIAPAETAR